MGERSAVDSGLALASPVLGANGSRTLANVRRTTIFSQEGKWTSS